jgi:hypothetical protein
VTEFVLALDDALAKNGSEPRCGLLVIDLNCGDTIAWVRIEGVVLYDVVFIPAFASRRPSDSRAMRFCGLSPLMITDLLKAGSRSPLASRGR